MAALTQTERPKLHRRPRGQAIPAPLPEPAPPVVAVFRRADDAVCHARCGQPLALQGVRGLIEADFYCYRCLAHVTLPIGVLEDLPPTPVIGGHHHFVVAGR